MRSQEIDDGLREKYKLGSSPNPYYDFDVDPQLYGSLLLTYRNLKEKTDNAKEVEQAQKAKAYFDAVDAYAPLATHYKQFQKSAQQLQETQEAFESSDAYHDHNHDQLRQKLAVAKENKKKLAKDLIRAQKNFPIQNEAIWAEYISHIPDTNSVDIPRVLDDGMHGVFAINGLYLLATISAPDRLALAILNQFMACSWNKYDADAGLASVYYSEERNNDHDKFWDKAQTVSAAQLLLATTINTTYLIIELLSSTTGLGLASTVIANAPAALGLLNGPSFAICMGISAANEYSNAVFAYRKSNSAKYYAQSCRDAATAECENLLQRLMAKPATIPSLEQVARVSLRIAQLEKDAEALECYAAFEEDQSKNRFLQDPTNRQKVTYAQLLIDRQAEKAKEHFWKGNVWSLATVAMVAACIAMPPVVVFAIAAVGLIKVGQTLHSRITDDYNQEAVKFVGNKNEEAKNEEQLLNDALKKKITKAHEKFALSQKELLQADADALKAFVSKEHRQELIYAQATSKAEGYDASLYLSTKATQAKTALTKKATQAKAAVSGAGDRFGSFFSRSTVATQDKRTLPATLACTA